MAIFLASTFCSKSVRLDSNEIPFKISTIFTFSFLGGVLALGAGSLPFSRRCCRSPSPSCPSFSSYLDPLVIHPILCSIQLDQARFICALFRYEYGLLTLDDFQS